MVGIAWLRHDTEEALVKPVTSRDDITIADDRRDGSAERAHDAVEREIEDSDARIVPFHEDARSGTHP